MSLTTKVADLATRIGTEFKTIRTEIDAAESAAITAAAADATSKASAAQAAAIAAAALDATAKADAAEADAITAAAADATTKANAAEAAAISAAATDATSKANAAQAAAIAAAATDATTKANAAQAAAIAYADALDTDDVAEGTSNLYFTAARAQSALSGMYDPAGSAATAETNAKAYADTKVASLVDGAPGLLDTLNELAAALGDDPSFASTISTALGLRVRVDAAQTFSSAQQSTGRSNIGAAAASDLGDVAAANFVTTFEAALV